MTPAASALFISIDGIPSAGVVDDALSIVERLEHRAGKDASGKVGDGVGIMLQVSHEFFSGVAGEMGIDIGGARDYGVGMFFFPQDTLARKQAQKMFEIICQKEGVEFIAWREVPVDSSILGERALDTMPYICRMLRQTP